MANMTFGVNLLPNNTGGQKSLGNSDQKWKIYTDSINGTTLESYAVCSTAAAEAAKTATITPFTLTVGMVIHINFTYANTASAPTLNVSNTGAKTIYLNNGNISPWDAGEVVSLTYDGTYWRINDYGKVEVVRL